MDVDRDFILKCNDVQNAYDKFENILNDGISKCIPTVKIVTKKATKPIWMTSYATNSLR